MSKPKKPRQGRADAESGSADSYERCHLLPRGFPPEAGRVKSTRSQARDHGKWTRSPRPQRPVDPAPAGPPRGGRRSGHRAHAPR